MEDDGFTLVTGKKAGNKSSGFGKFKKTSNGAHIRVDGTEKEIDEAMATSKSGIQKRGLGKWLCQKLESFTQKNRAIQKIFLIGNGHFDSADQQGAHQLALILEIAQFFQCELIFQEPVCSDAERNWLRKQSNIKIREETNTKLEICVEPSDVVLLVMIHGEHEIFNEFLDFNWHKIDNLIVIGNNYGGVDWDLSKLSAGNPKINEFYRKSIITPFPEVYEAHNSAFSSTVIMYPRLE